MVYMSKETKNIFKLTLAVIVAACNGLRLVTEVGYRMLKDKITSNQ